MSRGGQIVAMVAAAVPIRCARGGRCAGCRRVWSDEWTYQLRLEGGEDAYCRPCWKRHVGEYFDERDGLGATNLDLFMDGTT